MCVGVCVRGGGGGLRQTKSEDCLHDRRQVWPGVWPSGLTTGAEAQAVRTGPQGLASVECGSSQARQRLPVTPALNRTQAASRGPNVLFH